ncbi:hypothetical protein SKAU_G00274660 [Synaphobranchus kaupii]|uniref:Uncharacterized protein n=1 Tax=Synaphobranchus kaupii TaxID=118154 RepID=A0A9Q1F101_SYNKA|nr:hypothetical protein SKAU_G00274660 [Synaphobranchus kaupii]
MGYILWLYTTRQVEESQTAPKAGAFQGGGERTRERRGLFCSGAASTLLHEKDTVLSSVVTLYGTERPKQHMAK